ncbi:MAG TPA: biotin/lipoyl-containing protein [Ktedonobacterales bacterium]|nr:biotin/lipoyl-containing protein [Ktedonobacterales bacterium]
MAKEHEESRVAAAAAAAPGASLSIEEVRSLIQMMDASDVHELTIERESEGLRLTLRKPTPVVGAAPYVAAAAEVESAPVETAAHESAEAAPVALETTQKVTATLVGIFRVSLKRGAKAAVAEGDQVRLGQIVGAIEALNVMNEVETPVAGRVVEIVVKDGQPVEYGQHLMTIDTGASPS